RIPDYGHVPLRTGPDGERLSKRHGAVSRVALEDEGVSADEVRVRLLAEIAEFAPALVPRSG
ncbi:MAG: hypothetical protein ACKOFT_00070, partial [Actinomycetota bacterium]